MTSQWYFAYGSNMNPQRMAQRGMRTLERQAAQLHGWQLRFNKRAHDRHGVAYANIMPSRAGVVHGVLYQLADRREITRMDPFEGHPLRYRREVLALETAQGRHTAWTYIANADWHCDAVLPERAYLNHLLSGRPWLPESYYRNLLETPCLPDSDA
jgi:gamma-glutamylcyclotransferase